MPASHLAEGLTVLKCLSYVNWALGTVANSQDATASVVELSVARTLCKQIQGCKGELTPETPFDATVNFKFVFR